MLFFVAKQGRTVAQTLKQSVQPIYNESSAAACIGGDRANACGGNGVKNSSPPSLPADMLADVVAKLGSTGVCIAAALM